jgi:hypothetical protein
MPTPLYPVLPPCGNSYGNTFPADPADAFGGWCGQTGFLR